MVAERVERLKEGFGGGSGEGIKILEITHKIRPPNAFDLLTGGCF